MGIVIYIRTMIIHGDLITIIWIKTYFAMVYMYVHYYIKILRYRVLFPRLYGQI